MAQNDFLAVSASLYLQHCNVVSSHRYNPPKSVPHRFRLFQLDTSSFVRPPQARNKDLPPAAGDLVPLRIGHHQAHKHTASAETVDRSAERYE